MRLLLKIFVLLVVLAIIAVGAVLFYIDAIAARAVERAGTYAFGVQTTVDSVDVGVFSGELTLDDLDIANPEGFPSDYFLKLDEGEAAVELASLREDVVEMPRLILRDVQMNIDRGLQSANYDVILENLRRFEQAPRPADRKQFIIRTVEIRDVHVLVHLGPIAVDQATVNITIPKILLEDIGTGADRGLMLAELTDILLKAILAATIEQGGGILPADLLSDLTGELAQLESIPGMGLEVAGKIIEGLGKGAGSVLEDIGEEPAKRLKGIGDLLPGGD